MKLSYFPDGHVQRFPHTAALGNQPVASASGTGWIPSGIGWKYFTLRCNDATNNLPMLANPYRDGPAVPASRIIANCAHGHEPPRLECRCGIYFFYELQYLLDFIGDADIMLHSQKSGPSHAPKLCVARVEVYGPTLPDPAPICPGNFRAAAVRLLDLTIPVQHDWAAEELTRRYRVPVRHSGQRQPKTG